MGNDPSLPETVHKYKQFQIKSKNKSVDINQNQSMDLQQQKIFTKKPKIQKSQELKSFDQGLKQSFDQGKKSSLDQNQRSPTQTTSALRDSQVLQLNIIQELVQQQQYLTDIVLQNSSVPYLNKSDQEISNYKQKIDLHQINQNQQKLNYYQNNLIQNQYKQDDYIKDKHEDLIKDQNDQFQIIESNEQSEENLDANFEQKKPEVQIKKQIEKPISIDFFDKNENKSLQQIFMDKKKNLAIKMQKYQKQPKEQQIKHKKQLSSDDKFYKNQQLLDRLQKGQKPQISQQEMFELNQKNFQNLPEVKLQKKQTKKRPVTANKKSYLKKQLI